MDGLIFRSDASLAHDTGAHPECAARIVAIERRLEQADWCGYSVAQSPPASQQMLLRAHSASHIARVAQACASATALDPDTPVVPASYAAALHAAGGAVALVDALCDGSAAVGASLHRPPGHHAEAERAMGFCLFNNVAIAALQAIERHGLERVLVLDWDVHHGNGTEAIFARDPRVLFVSIHQDHCYPGTGAAGYEGEGAGVGFSHNYPLPAGSGDEQFLAMTETALGGVAADYRPQLILISAGFDAHTDDPLAGCQVTDEGFAAIARSVRRFADAAGIPVGLVLEGGYDSDALARALALTLSELIGVEATA